MSILMRRFQAGTVAFLLTMAVVAATALMTASAAIAGAVNLGFESPVASDGTIPGWHIDAQFSGVAVVGTEGPSSSSVYRSLNTTVAPHAGSHMLRLGKPSLYSGSQKKGSDKVSQTFTPTGSRLDLSFRLFSWEFRGVEGLRIDLKYADGTPVPASVSTFTITFKDKSTVTYDKLPITVNVMGITGQLLDTDWVDVSITGIPSDNRQIVLSYSLGSGNAGHPTWAYFDDANTPPTVTAKSYSTNEDTLLSVPASAGVLAGVTDPDGDALTASMVGGPSHALMFHMNADGSFDYSPAPNYNGPDSFTFKANDGKADSNVETVNITVVRVNDPPIADAQSVSTNEDTVLTGPLTATDIDSTSLTYAKVAGPSHGTVAVTSGGSFTYTPAKDYNGPDSFTFKANDGALDSNTATVSITVNPVNDPPVASDQSITATEDIAFTGSLVATDIDSLSLTYAKVTDPAHGTVSVTSGGSFTYTPAPNYNGPDSFTFKANDGALDSNVAVVSITVSPVNDPPVAYPQSGLEVLGRSTLDVTFGASDVANEHESLTFVYGQPANGTVTGAGPVVTYSPNPGASGIDTFGYRVFDGELYSNTQTISIYVDAPPVAAITVGTAQPLEGYYVDLLSTDSTDNDHTGIATYHWMVTDPSGASEESTQANVYFVPSNDGVWHVALTVTDAAGQSTTTNTDVTVDNAAPGVSALDIEVLPGHAADLVGRFIDCGWVDTHTATWSLEGHAPFAAGVEEDHQPSVGTGIATGTVPLDLTAGQSLMATLAVGDGQATSAIPFKVTCVADDPNRDEPNGSLTGTVPTVRAGSVHLSYVQSAGDVDFFEIKNPDGTDLAYNTQLLVTLKNLPADYDVALIEKPPADSGSDPLHNLALHTYALHTYPLHTYALHTYPLHTYALHTYALHTYQLHTYALHTYPLHTYALHTYNEDVLALHTYALHTYALHTYPSDFPVPDIASYPLSDMGVLMAQGFDTLHAGDVDFSELGLDALIPAGCDVVGYSASRGLANEAVLGQTQYIGSKMYVAIVGANGAHSDLPYELQVEAALPPTLSDEVATSTHGPLVTTPAYTGVTPIGVTPPAVKTLIVTAPDRMVALYGQSAWDSLQASLVSFAQRSPDVNGQILALPSSAEFNAWDSDPYSVDKANAAADYVREVIRSHMTADTRYVVIVGGDRVIPQRRVKDRTLMSNELYYLNSSFVKPDSPLAASLFGGYDLTDDFYVDGTPTSWQGGDVFVPDLPVGRLVEKPADIEKVLAAYVANDGVSKPTTAVVTGYDFFLDGAQAVASSLQNVGIGSQDTAKLISDGWTASDLLTSLLDPAKQFTDVNAHFSHYAALSAEGYTSSNFADVVRSTDLLTTPDALAGQIVVSVGCHAGLSVPDSDTVQVDAGAGFDPTLDFPQAMAKEGAIYIAPTGFGIGDDAGIAGTERLVDVFTEQLGSAHDMPVGDALVAAKQRYLTSLAQMTTYDVKSCIDWTLYGLPMYRADVPDPKTTGWSLDTASGAWRFAGLPLAGTPAAGDVAASVSISDGASSPSFTPTLHLNTTGDGSFYDAGSTFDVLSVEGRPLQPSFSVPLSSMGGTAHGVLLTGASFTETAPFDPVVATFGTGWLEPTPELTTASDAYWPALPAAINGLATGTSAQSLVVVPGQFQRATAPGEAVAGTQRLFNDMDLEVLRSSSTDLAPPTIESVDLRAISGAVKVSIETSPASDAVGAIVVLTVHNGTMTATRLDPAGVAATAGTFELTVPIPADVTDPSQLAFLVQVADTAGNVSVSTGKGALLHLITGVEVGEDRPLNSLRPMTFEGSITHWSKLAQPVYYDWLFGDGTCQEGLLTSGNVRLDGDTAYFTVQHQYASAADTLTTTLKVEDPFGGTGADSALLLPDRTAPTTSVGLSREPGPGGWYTSDVTLTLAATDTASPTGLTQYREYRVGDMGEWLPYTVPVTFGEGTVTIYYRTTDTACNVEASQSVVINVDKTGPVTSIDAAGEMDSGYYVPSATVTLGAVDALSGLGTIYYKVDGVDTDWKVYTAPFAIAQNGTWTVRAKAVDVAGNTGAEVAKDVPVSICRRTAYIGPLGSNANDGSPARPWRTIQYAIDHVTPGGTVIVAAGSYPETIHFDAGRDGISLVGPGATSATINGGQGSIVTIKAGVSGIRISGFTITSGLAADGGGVKCEAGSSVTITDCAISGNHAQGISPVGRGGGVFGDGATIVLRNCTLANNHADIDGGGVYVKGGSLDASGCTFSADYSEYGAGVSADAAIVKITGCTITGTHADFTGGALLLKNCTGVVISGNKILSNKASDGAGVYAVGNVGAKFFNNLFVGNVSTHFGGAVYSVGATDSGFYDNTVANNTAQAGPSTGGGGFYGLNTGGAAGVLGCTIFNNIFSGNGDDLGGLAHGAATYCYVGDGSATGNGNIKITRNLVPGFVSPGTGDFRLLDSSICCGKATSSAGGFDVPTVDILGNPRPMPTAKGDLGAYENQLY